METGNNIYQSRHCLAFITCMFFDNKSIYSSLSANYYIVQTSVWLGIWIIEGSNNIVLTFLLLSQIQLRILVKCSSTPSRATWYFYINYISLEIVHFFVVSRTFHANVGSRLNLIMFICLITITFYWHLNSKNFILVGHIYCGYKKYAYDNSCFTKRW